MRSACLPLLLLALTAGCRLRHNADDCSRGDRQANAACAARALYRHPARQLTTWSQTLQAPLAHRFGTAPPVLLDYLRLDDLRDGLPNRPRTAPLDSGFMDDVQAELEELPDPVKRLVEPKLAGIFVVDDLGSSGMTVQILDRRAHAVAGVVVVDSSVLRFRAANAWASWKESTPFVPEARWQLEAQIELPAFDTRRHAIQYLLLHELGHVADLGALLDPPWYQPPPGASAAAAYPFFSLSWAVDSKAGRYTSLFDAVFPQRHQVVYYSGPRLPAAAMPEVYGALERTDFPTLYAATNPFDDFAESFASFVHVVLMRRPFAIRLLHDGVPVKTYGACWEEPRCAAKRALLERLVAAASPVGGP